MHQNPNEKRINSMEGDEYYTKLTNKVLYRIRQEENKKAKRSLTIKAFVGVFVSIFGLVSSAAIAYYSISGILGSEFSGYFSLIFSDWSVFLSNINSFFMTIIESIPALEIIGLSTGALIGYVSYYLLNKNIKNYEYRKLLSV